MSESGVHSYPHGAARLALAASALAEAAQALSEAAAALSAMSQDVRVRSPSTVKSPSTVYESLDNTPQASESLGKDDEEYQDEEIDDGDSSVGANTGNNIYRSDTRPQDQYDPTLDHRNPPPATSWQMEPEPDFFGEQDKLGMDSLDEIICPGHFYIVLDEEFDALPLILAYATAGKRTVCYVPTSGTLLPWESIMSAVIPDRQVRSAVSMTGNSIMPLGDVVDEFTSSSGGSVLLLRPTYIARANETKAHSASNSLVLWGLPGQKFWPSTIKAVQQSQHTLFILSHREFHNPQCQNFFAQLGPGFTVHPRRRAVNSFESGCIMTHFRDHVQRTLSRAQHSQNIQIIYEELLEAPINDMAHLHFVTGSSTERIDVVNKFAARVFLRGRTQDGSPRFTFNAQGLQIPDKTHRRLGALFKPRAQPNQNRANVPPKPETTTGNTPAHNPSNVIGPTPRVKLPPTTTSHGTPQGAPAFSLRPGQWRITLQQEADAIPLICYLAKEHPTSICVISHSQSASPYGDLFDRISAYQVFRSGQTPISFENALGEFLGLDVKTGLCLLRGVTSQAGNDSRNFQWATANALIYWGLPHQDSFLWPTQLTQFRFKHVYLITPPAQLHTVTSLMGAAFPEHPESELLAVQGSGSLLHLTREKAKKKLVDMPRSVINDMAGFYKPVHPPLYPFWEFASRVMLRADF